MLRLQYIETEKLNVRETRLLSENRYLVLVVCGIIAR